MRGLAYGFGTTALLCVGWSFGAGEPASAVAPAVVVVVCVGMLAAWASGEQLERAHDAAVLREVVGLLTEVVEDEGLLHVWTDECDDALCRARRWLEHHGYSVRDRKW